MLLWHLSSAVFPNHPTPHSRLGTEENADRFESAAQLRPHLHRGWTCPGDVQVCQVELHATAFTQMLELRKDIGMNGEMSSTAISQTSELHFYYSSAVVASTFIVIIKERCWKERQPSNNKEGELHADYKTPLHCFNTLKCLRRFKSGLSLFLITILIAQCLTFSTTAYTYVYSEPQGLKCSRIQG